MSSETPRQTDEQAPATPNTAENKPAEVNPGETMPKEVGGRNGPEPTRYGDWEKAGICTDF